MKTVERPGFSGGANIAIKVPDYKFKDTVGFYRDTLGLEELTGNSDSVCFRFGEVRLWIDRMQNYSQTDIWLEVVTGNVEEADRYLKEAGIPRRDAVETLGGNLDGFWVSDPAGTILLVDNG